VQVHHNNGFFSDDLEQANRQVQGWTKVNVSSAYDLGRIQAQVYVRNLFDKFYLTYLSSATLATAGDPREFGVGVAARF
jgi:outer membrane receptor protein involved in Fe transport